MKLIILAYKSQGVHFNGTPEYIDYDSHIDGSGGLFIEEGVVISTKVIILSHDWSFLVGLRSIQEKFHANEKYAFGKVEIKKNSFIGAGAIILPNTTIGKFCVIGAGAVVKGNIPDYSIVIGNPANIIKNTQEWGKKYIQ